MSATSMMFQIVLFILLIANAVLNAIILYQLKQHKKTHEKMDKEIYQIYKGI